MCAAHCCLISTPARGRTLNSEKAQCPHVRLSVRSFACNHGSARPAPATAGAGLRWGGVGERFSRVRRGNEGRTPSSPAPRQSRAGAPPEPGLSPSQSRHQRSRNGGPRAPAAPEPRPVSPAEPRSGQVWGAGCKTPSALVRTRPPTPSLTPLLSRDRSLGLGALVPWVPGVWAPREGVDWGTWICCEGT